MDGEKDILPMDDGFSEFIRSNPEEADRMIARRARELAKERGENPEDPGEDIIRDAKLELIMGDVPLDRYKDKTIHGKTCDGTTL